MCASLPMAVPSAAEWCTSKSTMSIARGAGKRDRRRWAAKGREPNDNAKLKCEQDRSKRCVAAAEDQQSHWQMPWQLQQMQA
jgi:hypothetical protein